ncbi:MAG: LytTR family transcriptional regulator [Bacteroidales bacterium]|jgi:DNA-binding LytR/AlgR family response regulator|nr:LytTR family transcriptional regulator [Bacteroidales bacterium]
MNLDNKLILQNKQQVRFVEISDLLYIQVSHADCTFYSETKKSFKFAIPLTALEKLLPKGFIKINRNMVVNVDKIDFINLKTHSITMINGDVMICSEEGSMNMKKVMTT